MHGTVSWVCVETEGGWTNFRTSMRIDAAMPTIASAEAMQMHLVMFHSSGIGLVCTC